MIAHWRFACEAHDAAKHLGLTPLRIDALSLQAKIKGASGSPASQRDFLREAIGCIEEVRADLHVWRLRTAFLGDRQDPFDDLTDALIDIAAPEALAEAFHVNEKARSRALLDHLGGESHWEDYLPRSRAQTPEVQALIDEAVILHRTLNGLYSRLDDITNDPSAPGNTQSWSEQIRATDAELQRIETRLASVGSCKIQSRNAVTLSRTQAHISDGACLVEYTFLHGRLVAFVVAGDSAHAVRLDATEETIAELVERLRFQMLRFRMGSFSPAVDQAYLELDTKRELGDLYGVLIKPIEPHLKRTHAVHIVPAGPLFAVPFHALWDGERFLIDRFDFSFAPSASVIDALATNQTNPPSTSPCSTSPLVVGCADENIPDVDREVAAVAASLGTSCVLQGSAATKEAFIEDAASASILHVACHGTFNAVSPFAAGLRLADGWLTVRDLRRLRLPGTVVVLSGCDTGRVAVERGEEIMGWMHAFLAAGASSVVLSLWELADDAATSLMTRFYDCWKPGVDSGSRSRTIAATLAAAQRAHRAEFSHPALWAPCIHVGAC